MIILSSKEFRTNMMKYFTESNGDAFIVKTRDHGAFKVKIEPVELELENAIFKIPPEFRRNPYEISPSGDPFFADQRNIDMIEESLRQVEEGKTFSMGEGESIDDFLKRIENEL